MRSWEAVLGKDIRESLWADMGKIFGVFEETGSRHVEGLLQFFHCSRRKGRNKGQRQSVL